MKARLTTIPAKIGNTYYQLFVEDIGEKIKRIYKENGKWYIEFKEE